MLSSASNVASQLKYIPTWRYTQCALTQGQGALEINVAYMEMSAINTDAYDINFFWGQKILL